MLRTLRFFPALLVGLLALALAACGSGTAANQPPAGGGAATTVTQFAEGVAAQKVAVSADPSGALKWAARSYTATAGDVTFVVKNPSVVIHNFVIEGPGVSAKSANISANGTLNATLKGLKPGAYTIACTIAGHREGGMVATLTVK